MVHHKDSDNVWITDYENQLTSPVNPYTVCQFTGLKDCKGNEIWEGDNLEGNRKAEIFFTSGAFLIRSINDNGKEEILSLFSYIEWNGKITCRVIGNKFNNK